MFALFAAATTIALPTIDPTVLAWLSFGSTAAAAIAHARGNRLPGLSALFDILSGQAATAPTPATPASAPVVAPVTPAPSTSPAVPVDVAHPAANHPLIQEVLDVPTGELLSFLERRKQPSPATAKQAA